MSSWGTSGIRSAARRGRAIYRPHSGRKNGGAWRRRSIEAHRESYFAALVTHSVVTFLLKSGATEVRRPWSLRKLACWASALVAAPLAPPPSQVGEACSWRLGKP